MRLLSLQWLGVACGVAAMAVLGSCAGGETSFDSPESAARLRAIHAAASSEDRSAIPDLIRMLESDDPAVRLFSIRTLESMTGETFGYDATKPAFERREAVGRWNAWYAGRGGGERDLNTESADPAGADGRSTQEVGPMSRGKPRGEPLEGVAGANG